MPGGWYDDTSPEALEVFLQLHREMTPGDKIARVFEMVEFTETLQRAVVRSQYPGADGSGVSDPLGG